ncbi:MAG: hypothetical protein V4614_13450 [Pseudomonadota bacterium]
MSKLPTDAKVLRCIHDKYLADFVCAGIASQPGKRSQYLSIDVKKIAEVLECDDEILFGRLYYHLGEKYRYKQADGSLVPLFYLQVGDKRHVIHFPYLLGILAGLEEDSRKHWLPITLSSIALVVSVLGLFFYEVARVSSYACGQYAHNCSSSLYVLTT